MNWTSQFLPFLWALGLLGLSTLLGIPVIRKIVVIREAKHELKYGSAGYLRSMTGWFVVTLWLAATWFFATILGDWSATGDLEGAIERSMLRLRILLEILAALGDN